MKSIIEQQYIILFSTFQEILVLINPENKIL